MSTTIFDDLIASQQTNDPNANDAPVLNSFNTAISGQSFTAPFTGKLDSLTVSVGNFGTDTTSNLVADLYSYNSGSNGPGTLLYQIGSVSNSSLVANGYGNVTFTPTATIPLTVGTNYYIVLQDAYAGNTSLVAWNYLNTTNYSGDTGVNGTYSIDGGSPVSATNIAAFSMQVNESVCFASGTRILTAAGERAIETLAIGDLVITAQGEARPIRWLGHRQIDCRRHPRPSEVLPVRIAAHAFGPDQPARNLYLSPAHAVCVDARRDALVPVSSLVNGATIAPVDVDEVVYWHLELDSHDILLAENLPAESYLDAGNRAFFVESGVVALAARPDLPRDAAERARLPFCLPFHEEGPRVEAAREQLQSRAEALGWRLAPSDFAGLHLVANGKRIEPATEGLQARFTVPAGARDVWLAAETSRPRDIGPSADVRDLGVAIKGLALETDSHSRVIPLASPALGEGFYGLEDGAWRWMGRRARLAAELFAGLPNGGVLCVQLAAPALPRWHAPSAERHDFQNEAVLQAANGRFWSGSRAG